MKILLQCQLNFCIAITFFTLTLLCFFYQWPESRFSFYIWPWFLVLFFLVVKAQGKRSIIFISILMTLNLLFSPSSYWAPNLGSLTFNLDKIWLVGFIHAMPTDRKLNCDVQHCIEGNEFFKNSDEYQKGSLKLINYLTVPKVQNEAK